MVSFFFWKTWPVSYQRITGFFALLFLIVQGGLWWYYFQYPEPTFGWLHVQEQVVGEVPLRSFSAGITELVIPADNYIIFDQLLGDHTQVQTWAFVVFTGIFFFALSLLIAIITTFSRFWYLAAMTVLIVMVSYLRIEVLLLFNSASKLSTFGLAGVLIAVTSWFQFFRKEVSFFSRWLVIALLFAALGALIQLFARVDAPFLHLAVATIPLAVVVTFIFTAMVGHEILAALVTVITRGVGTTKSLRHFLFVSLIYFINLALAYAEHFEMIDWDFLYINFFLLLTISGILGIWGFRQRQAQLDSFLEDPFATLLYLAVMVIACGTIAFFWATANDPVLDAIATLSIYAHLGFGIIFFIYMLSNFGSMLEQNLEVHKVLYKPTRMPYFTFRLGGLIAVLGFMIYNGWQGPLHNAFAGFYNAAGDIYLASGETKTALGYYQQGGNYGFLNHHSNYAIADIEARLLNFKRERNFFHRATEWRPTEMSALNYAFTYQRENNPLEALLALQEPADLQEKGSIRNTRGLLLKKLNIADSALYYLQAATADPTSAFAAKTNLIGLAAEKQLTVPADSMFLLLNSTQPGVQSNAFALANQHQEVITAQLAFDLGSDTTLNLFTASLLHNYLINQIGRLDTTIIDRVVSLAGRAANDDYEEVLLVAAAKAYYEQGEVETALRTMELAIYRSSDRGKYNHVLALWALEQGVPDVANRYLSYSASQEYQPALVTQAVALAEFHQPGPSVLLWDSLQRSGDTLVAALAQKMVRVLASPESFVAKFSDEEKYAFTRYRLKAGDSARVATLAASMTNPNYRARTWLDYSKKLYSQDELVPSIRAFQNIKGLALTEKSLYEEIQHFELILLAQQRSYRALGEQINRGVQFAARQSDRKIYFTALLDYASGRKEQAAKLFGWLSKSNPFFAEGVTAAAQFYREQQQSWRAYSILAEALQRNPLSVKILKAYALAAAEQGLQEYAMSALQTLRTQLSRPAFDRFVREHQSTLTR